MSMVNNIWWVIDILKGLIDDSISYEECQNLENSLFFGEKWDEKYPYNLRGETK